jgi:hypothetical protein
MEIDLNNHLSLAALVSATENGASAGCPFCIGRKIAYVSKGNRIVFLKDRYAGCEATVVAEKGLNDDEFVVHFDGEPDSHQMRINYKRDSFAFLPISKPPDWLCDLAIDDLNSIDEAIVQTRILLAGKDIAWSASTLLPIVAVLRGRRLPIVASELWPTLKAHGFPTRSRRSFEAQLNFSLDLLCTMHGRPPIKRRKVKAMSIGRYLTPSEIDFYGTSPGIHRCD